MRIVFIGGGVAGLCGAMLLARDGHQVTVLERDAAPPCPPREAWDHWERRGVGQFRLPHGFLPRFKQVIDRELPEAVAALDAAGALRLNRVAAMPESISGGRWPGDERFEMITGRRPMVEATLAGVAEREPGVTIRRGVAVRGLSAVDGPDGIPHVTGVHTDGGEQVPADLVVDAGGRRSALPDWLEAIGAQRPPESREDSGFVYFARHFRSADGSIPPLLAPPVQHHSSVSLATLAADNGYWSVVLFASNRDAVVRAARRVDVWTRVVSAYPTVAHWLDAEAVTGVDVMASIEDRVRRFVVDGRPVATGVVAVGDSAACTSPSIGRGASIALLHAVVLRDVLRDVDGRDERALVDVWTARSDSEVVPLVDDTLTIDRHRRAQIEAEIAGRTYEPGDPGFEFGRALAAAASRDPLALRAMNAVVGLLERGVEVARWPGLLDRVRAVGPVSRMPGPDRGEVLDLLGVAA